MTETYQEKMARERIRRATIMSMYDDGALRTEIAKEFGISYARVCRIVREEIQKRTRESFRAGSV